MLIKLIGLFFFFVIIASATLATDVNKPYTQILCGGSKGLVCPEGYFCKGSYPYEAGECITNNTNGYRAMFWSCIGGKGMRNTSEECKTYAEWRTIAQKSCKDYFERESNSMKNTDNTTQGVFEILEKIIDFFKAIFGFKEETPQPSIPETNFIVYRSLVPSNPC